jgi:hypothetical protein
MEQKIAPSAGISYSERRAETSYPDETNSSGVSWAAVIAGGVVTAALALALVALGTGLGLSSVSLWSNVGVSASTLGAAAIVWLIFTQIISSSMGGYLAGRLRTKWARIHTDEVFFRDTAHGLLSWALALVVTAASLTSAATALMGTTGSSRGAPANAQSEGRSFGPNDYFVDALFRADIAKSESVNSSVRTEAGVIFDKGLKNGDLSSDDSNYLGHLVAARTGLSQTDASKRVNDVFGTAKAAGEAARKAIAHALLWTFLALLIGAFCASFSATIGGRQRDHVVTI